MKLEILNPAGSVDHEPGNSTIIPTWPKELPGTSFGILSNGKSNMAQFYKRLSQHIHRGGAEVMCSLVKEGPVVPAGNERLDKLASEADLIITGICDGGTATSWGVNDALGLVQRGKPVILLCTSAFLALARKLLPVNFPYIAIIEVPHPFSSLTSKAVDELTDEVFSKIPSTIESVSSSDRGLQNPGDDTGSTATLVIEVRDEAAAGLQLYELGMTDGLPIVPPTQERVAQLVKHWPSRHSNQADKPYLIPPRFGKATAESVGANAVMAGMPSALMPYLEAVVRAALRSEYNLFGLQTTTNPTTPLIVVGGPQRRNMGFWDGPGALGAGFIGNATLGRAFQLCLRNLGGVSAADGSDPATLGQPGKYSFCFAENDDNSPWPPLREQIPGSPQTTRESDAVTLFAPTGTMNMIIKSTHGEEFLELISRSISSAGSNDYMFGGYPLLALCPEHAEILWRDDWSLSQVQDYLFENCKLPISTFPPNNLEMMKTGRNTEWSDWSDDALIPPTANPSDISVCVVGGPSMHSTYLPSFGGYRPVTEAVLLPD